MKSERFTLVIAVVLVRTVIDTPGPPLATSFHACRALPAVPQFAPPMATIPVPGEVDALMARFKALGYRLPHRVPSSGVPVTSE